MNLRPYIELFSASLTPLIAIIATYIAYQQYRNNRAKLRHDLFERRMVIYDKAGELIIRGTESRKLNTEDLVAYAQALNEAEFLFGKDVCNYLKELDKQLHRKRVLELTIGTESVEDRHPLILEVRDIERWFDNQPEILNQRFMKYLNLKQLK